MAYLGLLGVLAAFAGCLGLIITGFPALMGRSEIRWESLKRSAALLLVGSVVSMAALEIGLLTEDFSIAYIANNYASGTPLIFTIASAWAALEGSIVLWGLVIAVLTYLVWRKVEKDRDDLLGVGALSIIGMVGLFFFGLMLTVSNPFEVCTNAANIGCLDSSPLPWAALDVPAAGRGTNPLLQNHIMMAIHPPLLYVGYVGLTIPFGFAMASLLNARSGAEWLERTRRWTLISWAFLTAGIVIGGWWSYEVLGWGGYWAWDPVENASFIPWLLATAFIHSSIVQARRGVLQSWNYVLVIGTFASTILGTFLTRSGVIASIHAFSQSPIGPAIFGFLIVVVVGSLAVFGTRVHLVASTPRLDSLVSREGVFLFNNLLLSVFAFVVLAGTLFPLLVEAFQGATVSVGPPFFDRWAIPLSFALLLAMGIGPVTPYRVADPGVVWNRIKTPLTVALGVGAATVIFVSRIGYVVLVPTLGTFVVAVIVRHLWDLSVKRAAKTETSIPAAAAALLVREPGYWGGQVSHIGVAVLAVGIAISANLVIKDELVLPLGQTVPFAGFELTYESPFVRNEPTRRVIGARVEISRDGKFLEVLEPRINEYVGTLQGIQTPAVRTTLAGDLYLSPTILDAESVSLNVWRYPLQWMVWAGGLMTALGAVISLGEIRVRRRESAPADA